MLNSSLLDSKLINGTNVLLQNVPFMASIKIYYNVNGTSDWMHVCGGSLISKEFVLTAGSCIWLINEYGKPDRSGAVVSLANNFVNGPGKFYKIKNLEHHPKFDFHDLKKTSGYDIGLILVCILFAI